MSVPPRVIMLVSVGILSLSSSARDAEALGGPTALLPSPDGLTQALHWTARGIEAVGIANGRLRMTGGPLSSARAASSRLQPACPWRMVPST